MEELETLVKMVAGLPTLTIWILAGYLAYRLAVIGSIYGVIRLAINRYFDYRTRPVEYKLGATFISPEVARVVENQIVRLQNIGGYIHASDADKLRRAIDLIIKKELE